MEKEPLTISNILSLEGELEVRKSFHDPWRSKYCRIADSIFSIFDDNTMENPIDTILITKDTRAELDGGENSLFFHISEGDKFVYGFVGRKIEETRKWVEIIIALTNPPPKLSMDDFNIISVIGRGFFGKVMLVENKQTKEHYAIKSVHKKKLIDSGRPTTIICERNIMMLVKNPFIVQLHFAFQTPTKFYLGLEYAPGGELFYHMESMGLIPIDDARLYVAEISIALEHLHKFGIVYRDLKPENILLDAEGHVKLTDFGLAKDLCDSANTTTKTFCGTNHYLAPEIVKKEEYSYEVDWWALGILLCEMLTGVTPFEGENNSKMFENIANEEPKLPYGIDEDAGDLITMLLTKDPKQRPRFNQIAEHVFFECLDWEYVIQRRYIPNFVPDLSVDPERPIQYFPAEFTQEAAIDSSCDDLTNDALNFDGFSYNAPIILEEESEEVLIDSSLVEELQECVAEEDDA